MSVHPIYSDEDEARLRKARAADPKLKPKDVRPPLRPIGWDVRWRQVGSRAQTSLRMLVAEGHLEDDAKELDLLIRRMKRENGGIAYRHMVLEALSGYRESETLEEFILNDFMKHVRTLKPSTQRGYAQAIDSRILYKLRYRTTADGKRERIHPKTNIAQMPIRDIGGQHLVEWLRGLVEDAGGVRTRTISYAIEVLRSAFTYAVELERIERNPIQGLRALVGRSGARKTAPVKRGQVIDPIDIERMRRIAELRGALRDELIVGAGTWAGFRPNEQAVLYLWEVLHPDGTARDHVELERGESLGVEVYLPKNGDPRVVKIFRPLQASIERYYDAIGRPPLSERLYLTQYGTRMTSRQISAAITRAARNAGVELQRPYDLRHITGSILANGGDESKPGQQWSWAAIGQQLGHSPGICQGIYQHAVANPRWRGMPIEQVIVEVRTEAVAAHPDGTIQRDRRVWNRGGRAQPRRKEEPVAVDGLSTDGR